MAKKSTPASAQVAAVAPGALGAAVITLAMVAEATASATGFLYVSPEVAKEWLDKDFVEVNNDMVNEAGAVATRVTAKGIASMSTTSQAAPAAGSAKPTFVIRRIPVQAPARAASENAGIYPFADLPAPEEDGYAHAFFVPATAARPEPWKTLASTVSSAQGKYRTEKGEETYTGKEAVLQADGKTPALDAEGKPMFREVEKTRKLYDYHRQFRTTRGFGEVRDESGEVVNNADGTPKKIEGAWVSRVK